MKARRNFYRLRSLPAASMLALLAEVEGSLAVLDEAGARFAVEGLGAARLYLPHPEHCASELREPVTAAIDAIADAMQRVVGMVFDRRAMGSAPLEEAGTLPLSAAATVLTSVDAATTDYVDPAEPDDGEGLAIVEGDGDDWPGLARDVADIVRSTRDVRITGTIGDEATVYALLYDADRGRGGRLDSLIGTERLSRATLFDGYRTVGGTVFLARGLSPGREPLADAGRVARAFAGDRILNAVRYSATDDRVTLYRVTPPERDAHVALTPDDPSGGALTLTVREVAASDDALAALQSEILRHDFPVGYRVLLRRLPEWAFSGDSIETLQARIDELEARISMLDGMQARQMTLLRFSPAQLGAMVDALRRVPRDRIDPREIRYAYGHGDAPDGRAHFLLCNPDAAVDLLQFSEPFWRAETEDRPMVYWVDPIWARQQEDDAEGAALLFVPRHMTLEPSLAQFGSDLEGTLAAVMGDLFLQTGPAREAMTHPVYVFTPGEASGSMKIELLDAAAFGPIDLRIKWINTHLQLNPPQVVDPALLEQVATDLYEGWAAKRIGEETAAMTEALGAAHADLSASLDEGIDDLARALGAEIDAATGRLAEAFGFLREVEARLIHVEALMRDAAAILDRQEASAGRVADLPDDLAEIRERLRAGLHDELRRAEALTEAVEDRLARHRERSAELRARAPRALR